MPNINLMAQTANGTFVVPAGYAIRDMYIEETAGHAITDGLDLGTSAAGTDVASAFAVGANAAKQVTDAALLKRYFSMTNNTTIYFTAHTSWASASINIHAKLVRVNN